MGPSTWGRPTVGVPRRYNLVIPGILTVSTVPIDRAEEQIGARVLRAPLRNPLHLDAPVKLTVCLTEAAT